MEGLRGSLWPEQVAAESPPETTTIEIAVSPSLCAMPQFVAGDLLRSEGFVDVQYAKPTIPALIWPQLTSGAHTGTYPPGDREALMQLGLIISKQHPPGASMVERFREHIDQVQAR